MLFVGCPLMLKSTQGYHGIGCSIWGILRWLDSANTCRRWIVCITNAPPLPGTTSIRQWTRHHKNFVWRVRFWNISSRSGTTSWHSKAIAYDNVITHWRGIAYRWRLSMTTHVSLIALLGDFQKFVPSSITCDALILLAIASFLNLRTRCLVDVIAQDHQRSFE